jgi:hypothetical protein
MRANCQFERKTVEVSRLDLWNGVPLIWALSTTPPVDALVRAYGDNFVGGEFVNEQAESLAGRFARFFGRLSGDYFRKLPSVSSGDRELAKTVAEGYLTFIEADELIRVDHLPIGGIVPPEGLVEAGDAALRPLSPEERGDLIQRAMPADWLQRPTTFPIGLQLEAAKMSALAYTAFLTIRSRQPKTKGGRNERLAHRLARVVLALQLMDYDIMGEGTAISWTEPGPRLWEFGLEVMMPLFSPNPPGSRIFASLGRAELQLALDLTERIPPECFDNPSNKGAIALHRFSLATSQKESAEALIDYVIALEALLVPGGSTTETTLRFCLNGARFLATDPTERALVYRDLKAVYKARSSLVHGTRPTNPHDLRDLRGKARTLASRGLVKALKTHWPTEKEFESAALS